MVCITPAVSCGAAASLTDAEVQSHWLYSSDKGQCASTVHFIFFHVLQYSPRNMFLSPVGELSRNEKTCFLARSTSQTVLWKKLICGNRGVAEGTATPSQISHNILSQTEPNMFIPPPPSNMEFLLKFFDLQNIFWTCSPNCCSWAGGWALVAEVWSHTLFSTCATRQQMLCSLLLFSTAQFWLLYFSRCWICLVSIQ